MCSTRPTGCPIWGFSPRLAVRHFVDPPAGGVTTIAARDRRVIMFVGTKHRADRLARYLLASGVPAAAPHGGKAQPQRTRALDQFHSGTVNALVATDPAALGHPPRLGRQRRPTGRREGLPARWGRTARDGCAGTVVTLVLPEQHRDTAGGAPLAGIGRPRSDGQGAPARRRFPSTLQEWPAAP